MTTVSSDSSSGDAYSESASIAVVSAVAAAKETDPTSLPPLYETIDPDVLDDVVACDTMRVSFEYAGYEIHVDGRGPIALVPLNG